MPRKNLSLVTQPLAANANAHPLDVLKMKSILAALGHYEAPDWGLSTFPDPALFDALHDVQRCHGLTVDGLMKPGGETEQALLSNLTVGQAASAIRAAAAALQNMGRNGDTILAHITLEEAQFLDAVTDGGSVNPHTGLLEFWSGKGGYNGPDRTHTSKDRDSDGGFDASADHKAMQNSVAPRGDRGGNAPRALSGAFKSPSGTAIQTKQAQVEATMRAGNEVNRTTADRSRRARTVLVPDNDPSFTSGFFDKKNKDREQEIWGSQKYWSPNDPPNPIHQFLNLKNPSQANGNDNTYREPFAPKRAGDPMFNAMTKVMFNLLTNDAASLLGLTGVSRFSPMMMLPGTSELLKKPDLKV